MARDLVYFSRRRRPCVLDNVGHKIRVAAAHRKSVCQLSPFGREYGRLLPIKTLARNWNKLLHGITVDRTMSKKTA